MASKNKGLTLRDKIRECDDVDREVVDCPEWKCKIEMRSPTSAQTSELEQWASARAPKEDETPDPKRFEGMKEKYIIACAFNPDDGKQIFSEADIEWLKEKSGKVIERLWTVAQRLTGLAEDEAEALGKNSAKEGT